jgi:ribosome biogenesis GTPase A
VRPRYADRLLARYGLEAFSGERDEDLLADIARRRGGLMRGGPLNLQKAAEIVINDFRSGAWGRITLESPQEFAQWLAAGQARDAERLAKRQARARKAAPQRGGPEAGSTTG